MTNPLTAGPARQDDARLTVASPATAVGVGLHHFDRGSQPAALVTHLSRSWSGHAACGLATVGDDYTTDPRLVTCHACQLVLPEAA